MEQLRNQKLEIACVATCDLLVRWMLVGPGSFSVSTVFGQEGFVQCAENWSGG
jgi:hypothetical protein